MTNLGKRRLSLRELEEEAKNKKTQQTEIKRLKSLQQEIRYHRRHFKMSLGDGQTGVTKLSNGKIYHVTKHVRTKDEIFMDQVKFATNIGLRLGVLFFLSKIVFSIPSLAAAIFH